MKAAKIHMAAAVLICSLVFPPNAAKARVHFSIGLGTTFGHHHRYYYPHHRWYDDCYNPWWGHSYWPGHYYPSRSSLWIYHSSPIILTSRYPAKATAKTPPPKPQLSKRMLEEQGELLRMLKIGDKQSRIDACRELTSLYFDDKSRAALEEALLKDPEPEIRKEVATLLGSTSDTKVIFALKTAKAKDPDRDVRQAAYRSLIMIEGY